MYNHRHLVIGSSLSHFKITAKLGEGGMGEPLPHVDDQTHWRVHVILDWADQLARQ